MGSATYGWMLRHVVRPGTDAETPWPYAQPTWVFSSRQHEPIPGADIRFVQGEVRHFISRFCLLVVVLGGTPGKVLLKGVKVY